MASIPSQIVRTIKQGLQGSDELNLGYEKENNKEEAGDLFRSIGFLINSGDLGDSNSLKEEKIPKEEIG